MTVPDFIQQFDRDAREAQTTEVAFRDEAMAEIARRERLRQFAFRRLDLARILSASAADAEDEEAAIAAQIARLRRELEWEGEDSPLRQRSLEAFRPLALAIWREAEVAAAFTEFETWYEREIGAPFLALLDVEMPERPVVEF